MALALDLERLSSSLHMVAISPIGSPPAPDFAGGVVSSPMAGATGLFTLGSAGSAGNFAAFFGSHGSSTGAGK